jgi:DNA-binding transcriptional LysR family regulator
MNVDQIRGFVAVAERKSMTIAARELHVSQPALSRQIGRLEHEAGTQLFYRGGGQMQMTESGAGFLPEAYRILDDVHHAMIKLKQTTKTRYVLRIGGGPLLVSAFIGEAILSHAKEQPHVDVKLSDAPLEQQLKMLRDGLLDLVCTDRVPAEGFIAERIARVPLLKVTPVAGTNSKSADSKLTGTRDRTFVIPDRNKHPNGEALVREACRRAGFSPKIMEVDGVGSVLSAIALGKGLGILPAHFCLMQHPGVSYDSLRLSIPESDVVVLTRPQVPSPCTQQFILSLKRKADIRYKKKFWMSGPDGRDIVFPGADRRRTIRRK